MHQFSLLAADLSNIRLSQIFVDDVFFLAKDLDRVNRRCQLNHPAVHQINPYITRMNSNIGQLSFESFPASIATPLIYGSQPMKPIFGLRSA